jgi:Tfp pilus assembly protein PilO
MIKLLYFVLGIYIYIKFYQPIINEIYNIQKKISILDSQIKKYQIYIKKKEYINKIYRKTLKIDKENKKLFFQGNSTIIYTKIQQILQHSIPNSNIINIKWLNNIEEDNFIIYPISIKIKAYPHEFRKFLKKICKNNKILYIKDIKINAINPKVPIRYNITIYGFKIKE